MCYQNLVPKFKHRVAKTDRYVLYYMGTALTSGCTFSTFTDVGNRLRLSPKRDKPVWLYYLGQGALLKGSIPVVKCITNLTTMRVVH